VIVDLRTTQPQELIYAPKDRGDGGREGVFERFGFAGRESLAFAEETALFAGAGAGFTFVTVAAGERFPGVGAEDFAIPVGADIDFLAATGGTPVIFFVTLTRRGRNWPRLFRAKSGFGLVVEPERSFIGFKSSYLCYYYS